VIVFRWEVELFMERERDRDRERDDDDGLDEMKTVREAMNNKPIREK
jgi:hypothetical protein